LTVPSYQTAGRRSPPALACLAAGALGVGTGLVLFCWRAFAPAPAASSSLPHPLTAGCLATAVALLQTMWLRFFEGARSRVRSVSVFSQTSSASHELNGAVTRSSGSDPVISQIDSATEAGGKFAEKLLAALQEVHQQSNRLAEHLRANPLQAAGFERHVDLFLSAHSQTRKHIGPMVSSIQRLARQSNLIAVNAAIEAARAGEAGSRFAAVAGDMRQLALKSQELSEYIEQELREMAGAVKRVGDQLRAMVQLVNESAKHILATSELLHQATLSALAQMQVQDIARQQLDQVRHELVLLLSRSPSPP